MGVWGWDEIRDGVTLQGVVEGSAGYFSDDDDWSFKVRPAQGYKSLLTNQDGFTNQDGQVECEVQPDTYLNVDEYLNNGSHAIDKEWVTVTGTFTRDRSHSVDGSSIGVFDDGDKGKTEIHPITSVLVEHRPANDNRSRLVDFFVFSSGGSQNKALANAPIPAPFAPHTGESRLGTFKIPIPLGATPTFVIRKQKSEPPDFKTIPSSRFSWFEGQVWSGRFSEGKGFFSATIQLPGFTLLTYLVSRGINFRFGVLDLMKWAGVKSLRGLFNKLDTVGFVPPVCAQLQQQIASVESQIAGVDKLIAQDVKEGVKPSQDQELQNDKQALESKLTSLRNKAQELGCS